MYKQHNVAVVIPVHNEESFIANIVRSIPNFVDAIVTVDDASTDNTLKVITRLKHPNLHIVKHERNRGVGAATVSGYKAAVALRADIIIVIDGDGQMDITDMPNLLDAIIFTNFDYVKGNRFLHSSISSMPKLRYLGNCLFSRLMQYTAGIDQSIDSQCGYSAIAASTLSRLDLDTLYPRYGFLNTLLFNLAAINAKIGSVPVRTIYGKEVSGINPFITVPTILYIILRGYLRRLNSTADSVGYSEV